MGSFIVTLIPHDDRRVPADFAPVIYLTRLMRGGEYMDCWPGNEVSRQIREDMKLDSTRVKSRVEVK